MSAANKTIQMKLIWNIYIIDRIFPLVIGDPGIYYYLYFVSQSVSANIHL